MHPSPRRETSSPASDTCLMEPNVRPADAAPVPWGRVQAHIAAATLPGRPAHGAESRCRPVAREAHLNPRRPAAVLFDMDGTLVDSEKVWDIALKELARRAGGELSPSARKAMIGSNMGRTMRLMREDLGQPDRPEAPDVEWLTNRVFDLFRQGLVWRP